MMPIIILQQPEFFFADSSDSWDFSIIKWMGDWVIKCVKIYKSSNQIIANSKSSETKSQLILNTHRDTCLNFPAFFLLQKTRVGRRKREMLFLFYQHWTELCQNHTMISLKLETCWSQCAVILLIRKWEKFPSILKEIEHLQRGEQFPSLNLTETIARSN